MNEKPRIEPLPEGEWPADLAPILEAIPDGSELPLGAHNIFRTFAGHPDLFRAWLPFAAYLLSGGGLPARDRELIILRVAVRCRSSYEWGQHVRLSLGLGIEREAIDRVLEGPDAEGWTGHEAGLLRAVDELHDDDVISQATWDTLAETYGKRELMEATLLAGQYHMVAFALRSFGVQLDDGLESLPDS